MNIYSKLSGYGIGKIPGIYNTFLNFQHIIHHRKDIIINDIKYPLIHDPISNKRILSYYYQCHEPNVTKYFKQNIIEGNRCVDVGANIGYFTLLFAKLVGTTGKVIAFEPECISYKALNTSLDYNNITNTFVLPITINSQMSIDKLVPFDIDYIKIDVEGHEVKVLNGMISHLEHDTALKIICEVHPTLILKNNNTIDELNWLLNEYEYNTFSLESSKILPVKISAVEHTNHVYLFTKDLTLKW